MKNRILYLLFFLVAICGFDAKVRLPALVSDGMILQRNQDLKIWGYADAGEKLRLSLSIKRIIPQLTKMETGLLCFQSLMPAAHIP